MNVNPGNGRADLSLDWVKRQFHAIGAVEPPSSLKDRLEAGIPAASTPGPIMWHVRLWRRGGQWTVAAAAVLALASAVAWLGAPWGSHTRLAADANNSLRPAYATDHNSLRPPDTNLFDTNSLR
jgi:HAMP domain-containing protein